MVTKVINQDDLTKKVGRRAIDDAGDCAKKGCVCLIMEDDYYRGCW